MGTRDGLWERALRWAVDDAEAAEGLLGDLEEEWSRRGRKPGGAGWRLALLGLTLRYLGSRLLRPGGQAPTVRDVRFAVRSLARRPGHSLAVLATLALGMGAAIAVFSVLHAVVLRPLPYQEPQELVRLQSAVPGLDPDARWHMAKAQYLYLRDNSETLAEAGLYVMNVATVGALTGGTGQAERVRTAMVNPGVFQTLRLRPVLGRAFTEDESVDPDPGVVLLTHRFWRRAFGEDPAVVGTSLAVDGRSRVVVGVLPPAAELPEEAARPEYPVDLWMPLHLDPAERPQNSHVFRAVGRLAPGATTESANRELRRLTARLPDALPEAYSDGFMEDFGFHMVATPLQESVVGGTARVLWVVFGSVGLLLLVAGFNAANLVLARSQRRERELGIRSALGAGTGILARQLLVESALLSLAAGAVGVGLASWGTRLLVTMAPVGVPRLDEVTVGPLPMLFALALSLLFGLLFGVLPLWGNRTRGAVLGDVGRGLTSSPRQHLLRRSLVVGQLAVSLVLLSGASLLFRSFQMLTSVETGIAQQEVLTFRVVLPADSYDSEDAVVDYYRQAAQRLEALPGVGAAGMASALPLDGFDGCAAVQAEGQVVDENQPPPCLPVIQVAPGYFEAMGMELRGEEVTWADLAVGRSVMVASEALARRFWPDRDPVGQGVTAYGQPMTAVTGVVSDVRGAGLAEPVWQALYVPIRPARAGSWPLPRFLHFAVRADGTSPQALIPGVRRAMAEIDPDVPLADIRPMADVVASSTAQESFLAVLMGLASVLAVLLSGLGVYAVISYIVTGRRGEIGVRLALGAASGQVRRMVVGQSLLLAGLGVAMGLALTLPATGILRGFLYGVSPTDPVILAGVAVMLLLLTGVAAFAPARRATRVDPVEALRAE